MLFLLQHSEGSRIPVLQKGDYNRKRSLPDPLPDVPSTKTYGGQQRFGVSDPALRFEPNPKYKLPQQQAVSTNTIAKTPALETTYKQVVRRPPGYQLKVKHNDKEAFVDVNVNSLTAVWEKHGAKPPPLPRIPTASPRRPPPPRAGQRRRPSGDFRKASGVHRPSRKGRRICRWR